MTHHLNRSKMIFFLKLLLNINTKKRNRTRENIWDGSYHVYMRSTILVLKQKKGRVGKGMHR